MADDAARPITAAGLRRVAEDPGRLDLIGAPEGFDALVMADIVRARKGLTVFVARDGARLSAFAEAFAFFAPNVEVLAFPSWDCLPYDRVGPSAGVAARRMTALSRLAEGLDEKTPRLLVTAVPALIQRVPPRSAVKRASYSARAGNVVEIADLERYFAVNGYVRASTVSEHGEFAIRGGVIDVFPPAAEEPVRLDLFGDTLESIRAFDPETQRSTKQLKEVALLPVSEALLDGEAIARFRTGYLEAFGSAGDDPLYATVAEGGRRAGMEHWLPLFYPRMETLFDYLPPDTLVALDHLAREARDERLAMIRDAHEARTQTDRRTHYHPLEPERLYLDEDEWADALKVRASRRFTPFQEAEGEAVVDMGARAGRSFAPERQRDSVNLFEATAHHAEALSAAGKRVLFASWSEGSSERLGVMLADHGLKNVPFAPYWDAAKAASPKIPQRVVLPLESGFETDALAVISETDILGDRLARPRRRRRATNFLAEASALTPGDLVVHIDHGIGRYAGLKTLDVQGAPHDTLELHYGAEAKLYLPVENIDLLTRYGAESEGVQLDRLGGAAWQARKAKAKERLREMAEGLIRIAAERATKASEVMEPPHGVFDEFCARFPYEETDDQLAAIGDVLADLAAGKPMDRLICGDVGFGKTEVALRAAFVVAMCGKQVAVVAPTTLLARQHYKTFTERFEGWPVRVRRLSRLVPSREAAETREAL
ncbi:MAG TPA: CarD family transcriptional regulator, partial [Phenylobacterium sp.]|nr:CarD family transcriptional regulator [Phenylobacterium sp.]